MLLVYTQNYFFIAKSASFDGFANHDAVENSGRRSNTESSRFPTVISGLQCENLKR